MNGNDVLEFEEQHFVEMAERFIRLKDIEDKWIAFVYEEYEKAIQDREPPEYDPFPLDDEKQA